MRLLTETPKTLSLLTSATLLAALTAGCGDDGNADGTGDGDQATSTATDDPTTTETPDTDEPATETGDGSGDQTGDETGEPGCEIDVGEWSAPEWDANAAEALAIRAALDTLTGDANMRGAETGKVDIASIDDLVALRPAVRG